MRFQQKSEYVLRRANEQAPLGTVLTTVRVNSDSLERVQGRPVPQRTKFRKMVRTRCTTEYEIPEKCPGLDTMYDRVPNSEQCQGLDTMYRRAPNSEKCQRTGLGVPQSRAFSTVHKDPYVLYLYSTFGACGTYCYEYFRYNSIAPPPPTENSNGVRHRKG